MNGKVEDTLFCLLSVGLGTSNVTLVGDKAVDWTEMYAVASRQGVSSICLDGLKKQLQMTDSLEIGKNVKLQWIASAMKQEQSYGMQWQAAKLLADIYSRNNIDTYVLKGFSLSRLYPQPTHRACTDMDCFLLDRDTRQNAYGKGNKMAAQVGLSVDSSYYKHSKIGLRGLTVENHKFLLPVKGSGKAKRFERELRSWIDDGHNEYIKGSSLKATSPFFDAVYVLAHAQEHFLSEGIILRHICDWAMVLQAHADSVNWDEWKRVCREYGMLSFGYAVSRLARRVCSVAIPFDCPEDEETDRRLLDDTLGRKHGSDSGRSNMQVRIGLVKNMLGNSWKYRMFSDTNFLVFCGRRVLGYFFDKDLD